MENSITTETKSKKKPIYKRWWFWALAPLGLFILIGIFAPPTETTTPTTNEAVESNVTKSTTKTTQPATKPTNSDSTATVSPSTPTSSVTVSQKNAVKRAKTYLSLSGFSHDGLVAQLEYEKFSHEDAVYGVDNSGANWNEQAAKKAKAYMTTSSFSRGGLIAQLEYEKFTSAQAEYGANAVGL
jgi:hypothetical protein